jgi:hypothetical protein
VLLCDRSRKLRFKRSRQRYALILGERSDSDFDVVPVAIFNGRGQTRQHAPNKSVVFLGHVMQFPIDAATMTARNKESDSAGKFQS